MNKPMRRDVFVYLSGPITAVNGWTIERNIRAASMVYYDLLNRGIPAFCPHSSAFDPRAFADVPYDVWLEYDCAVIDRCTHLLMLPRWEQSQGAMREKAYAEAHGKRIILSHIELLTDLGMI